ncbi:MAG: UvrB/UvrC motif-containing protein [Elusimicrobia bacterium]|nr:UvrB/UvrC motif-containing protein [Elusimicrobiota bacterium]
MLCDICKKRDATVFVKKIENDNIVEQNLCEVCAFKVSSPAVDLDSISKEFYGNLSDILVGYLDREKQAILEEQMKCPVCGSSFRDFEETGRLGCSACYEAFFQKLEPLLKRLQGSVHHAGKSPLGKEKWEKIEKLKEELQSCIKNEEYEMAAVIRDKIRLLEKKGAGKEGNKP